MIQISPDDIVNIPDLLGLGAAGINARVQKLTHLARTELVRLAKRELHTSQAEYERAIQPVAMASAGGKSVGIVALVGTFPNMVENGQDAWDLRETLLKPGGKVKRSARGFLYRVIPFRHMGPTASGKHGSPVGQAYTSEGARDTSRAFRGRLTLAESRTMGRAVWKRAQALQEARAASPGKPAQPAEPLDVSDIAGAGERLRGRHAAPIYAGMIRQQKTYERATQSAMMTFRVISNDPRTHRSDGDGVKNWTHPGLEARHLFAKADAYIGKIAEAVLQGGD